MPVAIPKDTGAMAVGGQASRALRVILWTLRRNVGDVAYALWLRQDPANRMGSQKVQVLWLKCPRSRRRKGRRHDVGGRKTRHMMPSGRGWDGRACRGAVTMQGRKRLPKPRVC